MTRYKTRWGSEERAEYDALVAEASDTQGRITDQVTAFIDGIDKAADQAHRPWAQEVRDDMIRRGASAILKAEMKRADQVDVTLGERTVAKTKRIGVKRLGPDGSMFFQQALFDDLSVDDLRMKRNEYIRAALSYDDNIRVADKLVALCESAGADTPAEAAHKLGTTVEAWLGRAAA